MFNAHIFENSRSHGHGVLQVVELNAGMTESVEQFIALKETRLSGQISGPLASLTLRQDFGYARADCEAVLEAVYRFPLPGDAAVTDVRVRFGDVEIVTRLKEREAAEEEYAAAKEAGRQATLLSRESPDVFTLQIAGIRPDEDVTINTSFVQLARADGLRWVLRVPLTTAPRFVREDELGSAYANGQPLALLRDPGHRFSMKICLEGAAGGRHELAEAGTIESPTQKLSFEQDGDDLIVQLAAGAVIPDRDCILMWQAAQASDAMSMTVYGQNDAEDGFFYFLTMMTPPAIVDDDDTLPREVLLLVDHSGSMTGPKWAAADWAVERFLSDLTPDDSFALAAFHTDVNWYRRDLVAADPEIVDQAVQWLTSNRDSGGTNLGVALEQALRIKPLPGEHARNVLIVTDAQVSDMGRLLRLVDQEAAKADGRRISILCVDAAPNSYLVNRLTEKGGGIAKFLTSSPEETDITTALDQVLTSWGEPVMVNLRLAVNRPGIESAGERLVALDDGRRVIDAGDLVSGQSRWIVGRVRQRGDGPIVLSLLSATGELMASARGDETELLDLPAVKALFGARRINGLEHLLQARYSRAELIDELRSLGYDPQTPGDRPEDGIYAETQLEGTQDALRYLLVDESLAYQLPSSVVSFVGVRIEAGERVAGTVAVANALPAGWSDQFPSRVRIPMHAVPAGARKRRAEASRPDSFAPLGAVSGPAPAMMPQQPAAGFYGSGPMGSPAFDEWTTLYQGPVLSENGAMLLYDSTQSKQRPPAPTTISGLRAAFDPLTSDSPEVSSGVEILVYVGDPALPRALVRLSDLLRHGERPLNLTCGENQLVRIELRDPGGELVAGDCELQLEIRW